MALFTLLLTPAQGTKITSYPSLEPDTPGTYNDQVLELYDDFMIDAHSYGIKVFLSVYQSSICLSLFLLLLANDQHALLQLFAGWQRCVQEVGQI